MTLFKLIPLVGSAIIFAALLFARLSGQKRLNLLLGLAATIFFALCNLFFDQITWLIPQAILGHSQYAIGAFYWFSLAFLINELIKLYYYQRKLTPNGDPAVPHLLQHLITTLIYLIVLMVVMRFIFDQSITAIATASGAIALVLGYSSRTILDEVFSGLAIYANEPFEKDDLIQLNDEWGYVKDINWRSITYLDMDQNEVVVPNTTVAASKIRNLDRPSVMTRRTIYFRAEYNVPPKIVVEECDAAMKECPHVADHPWNFSSFFSFDEKGMNYKLHFHVAHYDHWYVASDELINAIWYRFARKGIRFAHQRHLNFTTPEDEKQGLPHSAYDDASRRDLIERFKQVPMFEGMTKKDMEELAESAKWHIFGPPERMVQAGSLRTSMFIIVSGLVDIYNVDDAGVETWMMTSGESECIGIMPLLTGVSQSTTSRAKAETVVWEITSESLHALFERKPQIMKNIAANVAKWQADEDEALNTIAMNKRQERAAIKKRTHSLSELITRFFDLRESDKDDKKHTN